MSSDVNFNSSGSVPTMNVGITSSLQTGHGQSTFSWSDISRPALESGAVSEWNETEPSESTALHVQARRIRYESPDGTFQVITVVDDSGAEYAMVVRDGGIRAGERFDAWGSFSLRRDELQFVATRVERPIPGVGGLAQYLSSGLFKGVGPVLAARLVETFGERLPEVLQTVPSQLASVQGVSPKLAASVGQTWEQLHGQHAVMTQLMAAGLSRSMARRLMQRYGARAGTLLREDPYRFAREVGGIGFKRADEMARAVGIERGDPRRLVAAVFHAVDEASQAGHVGLPESEVLARAGQLLGDGVDTAPASELLVAMQKLLVDGLLVRESEQDAGSDVPLVHIPEALEQEQLLAGQIAARASFSSLQTAWDDAVLAELEQMIGVALSPSQREALIALSTSWLAVLTGGPGTGKTTIVRAIVEFAQRQGWKLGLCAPTGRAARRLSEATGQQAFTIHRMLGYDPRQGTWHHDASNPMQLDMLVVDEVSMLDQSLAVALFDALGESTRVLLVGDVDQLPSVGAGDVLSEVISSGVVEVRRLREIHRQAAHSGIVTAAHAIAAGTVPEASNAADSDFYLISSGSPDRARETLERLLFERIPERFGLTFPADIQVLVPMHAGSCGTEAINRLVQGRLHPDGGLKVGDRRLAVGDRVMQTRNNYDLEVFNGDIGVISDVNAAARTLRVLYDDRWVEYDSESLDELELAYAITIHKSQGSEFPCVVTVLTTQHFRMLQRNLLYTAVTRARQLLVVLAMPRALELAVQDAAAPARRHTRLARRIRHAQAAGSGTD
jgi:exodeoxyribonuclease V alpha subunit